MRISYQLSRVDDSDLWLALALLLCAFEKNVFALFAFGLGLFCVIAKTRISIKEKNAQKQERENERERI